MDLITYEILLSSWGKMFCNQVEGLLKGPYLQLFFYVQELNEFWGVNTLLEVMVKKLSYTASLELVPLMEVPGVKQVNIELFSKSVAEQLLYTEKNNAGEPPRMRVKRGVRDLFAFPSSSLFPYIRIPPHVRLLPS